MDADLKSGPEVGTQQDSPDPGPEPSGFYIHKDGVNYGPEPAENIHLLCVQGWLRPDDLVWQEGQAEWQPAGILFTSSFTGSFGATALQDATPDTGPDSEFFQPGALRLYAEPHWPWGAFGTAIVIHAILLVIAFEWLRLYPLNFTAYTTVPPTEPPPLEVAMMPEPVVPPPPPPEPPDPVPPPPVPQPPPMPDLTPPPPPAPPVMAIPTPPPPPPPPPPAPEEPIVPQEVATKPLPPSPPVHHKAPKPVVQQPPLAPAPAIASSDVDSNQPEYLANPRPEYPIGARQRRQQGTVLLLVTMDDAGNPVSVSVERTSGYSVLDHAALKKVEASWRFKPGQSATVHVPVEFHLDE